MSNYNFRRLESESLKTYSFDTYEEALSWVQNEIDEFKKINKVLNETKDRYFISFKEELLKILELQKIKNKENNDIALKCNKCIESDHEGIFCRCENRNIKLAKQQREKGKTSWKNIP